MIPTALHPLGRRAPPLPYDALVEYVESTGAQRINTGIIARPKTVSDITFRWVGNPSGDEIILGARNNSLSAPRFILLMTNASKARQIGAGANWLTSGNYVMNTDYNAVTSFDNGRQTQNLDGKIIIKGNKALDNLGINLYLFAINTTGIFGGYAKARVYSCKIYQDDVLVRDFAPCRVGTAGALYDRVSGTLYYSATSTALIPGPDLP